MRKKIFFAVLLSASMATSSAQDGTLLRIGTYNLRMQNMDKNTPDRWELRHQRCIQSILDNGFDIFGVQEIADFAEDELSADLAKDYACIFFSPYNANGKGGKASGIFYKKKRFKKLSYHYFWISDTPGVPSDNDHFQYKGKQRSYKRGGACAVFKDRLTGRKIFFMNHHGIINKEENLKYAGILVDIEKKYNPKGYPSFFVGDFNVRADHPSHKLWRAYWSDAADIALPRQCTMNAFDPNPDNWQKARHIDYIYHRNAGTPLWYTVNQKLYDGRCASDHFPVWADFKL